MKQKEKSKDGILKGKTKEKQEEEGKQDEKKDFEERGFGGT